MPDEWYYIADDSVRHYVTEFGHGDTVVVLHGGFGAEHSYLLDAVRPLADRFHFVLYDQRGSLRSPAPDSTITLPRLVRDLEGLRRQLGQDRLVLFGHSMGTVLAYAYLAEHPERVRGLVLTGPVLPTYFEYRDLGVPSSDTARLRQLRDGLSADQLARRRATVTAEGLNRGDTAHYTDREKSARWQIVFGATNLYHVERWRQVRGGQVFYNPRVSRAIYANSSQAQRDSLWGRFLPALGSFAGPVTVVIGDADFVDPGAALWRYALARLPRAQLIMLSQTGHSAWIDQPERFHDAVSGALRRALVANP